MAAIDPGSEERHVKVRKQDASSSLSNASWARYATRKKMG